jgi:hypothetical protein
MVKKRIMPFWRGCRTHHQEPLGWCSALVYIRNQQWDYGILEGIDSLIQAAKARARGYRTERTLITMIYLIAGKLKFDLPT